MLRRSHGVIVIVAGLILLTWYANGQDVEDKATLRTIILGLKHRANLLPAVEGVYVRKVVTYLPDSAEEQNATRPYRAVLKLDHLVQTETGYWHETWLQNATSEETSILREARLRVRDEIYEILPRAPFDDNGTEAMSDVWTNRAVHIYAPRGLADKEDFLDPMGALSTSAGSLAQRIESRSPELLGREEINGLECYVVRCSGGGYSSRYWICPEKQFVLLKHTDTAADERHDVSETAVRLGSLAGVPVVTATAFTRRARRAGGPPFVHAIGSTQFQKLTPCRGNGYEQALVASVMRTGMHWFHRGTTEGGWVGPDPEQLGRVMSSPQAAEQLILEEMDTEFAITDQLE